MAISKVLKVCPVCQGELSFPPPKHCPMCQSKDAWDMYISKEVAASNSKHLSNLMYAHPLTVSEQMLAKIQNINTTHTNKSVVEVSTAEEQYHKMFFHLPHNTKKAVVMDAFMVIRTLMCSDHSSEEIAEVLKIAAKIGPLVETLQKSLSQGILVKKGLSYEPRAEIRPVPADR